MSLSVMLRKRMKYDVICFGALNVDKLYMCNRIASKEEESFIIGFKEACGGAAANTAVGLSRLGLKVGFIGKLSNDRAGRKLLKEFERENVDTNGIVISNKGKTGIVIGFIDKKGDRALYAIPGVNNTLNFNEINLEYAEKCSFLHLTPFVGDDPFYAQKRIVEMLFQKCKISLDPGNFYISRGIESLRSILEKCYFVSVTERELKILTNEDYKRGAEILLHIGVKIVAVKLGSKGCYITNGKEEHYVKPFKVKVVDTTGAGEAFNAGFLYGLITGKDLCTCGKIGNYVASRCISKIGARTGLPYLAELMKSKII